MSSGVCLKFLGMTLLFHNFPLQDIKLNSLLEFGSQEDRTVRTHELR